MKTITGTFDSSVVANNALSELLSKGFSKDDISLLMMETTRDGLFSSTDDEANRVAKGGVTGAVVGGALGALIAGLVAMGTIVIPGSGLWATGPIVTALSGAGAGATVGGLSGALIEAGFAADEANLYEEEVKKGKTVIIVHVSDANKEMTARTVLGSYGKITKAA